MPLRRAEGAARRIDMSYVRRLQGGVGYPCDPVEVGGVINLDFDETERLVGIEVLEASSKLPQYLLDAAERLDAEDV